jgi:mono/diheme cytochrome c family protein
MNEAGYIRRFRWISLVSGTILVLLLATAWIRESFLPGWKLYQSEYRGLVYRHTGEEDLQTLSARGIRQVSPKGLKRTDRCITCHLGIENPAMEEAPQPHTLHPGEYLARHPVEKFGCTVCHGGQGRAIDRVAAFGEDPSTHWNFPLLRKPYLESSCGKCHLGIFSGRSTLEGTGTFIHGKEIFKREGCLGCHRARGVGGIIGPDLTEQGEKTKHEYNFTNIRGEQSISNWMKEHFIDPELVSPGSDMLKMDLPAEEMEALVTFTMGLVRPDISYDYLDVEALSEFRGKRTILGADAAFAMTCSACHGKEGEGKDYQSYKTGVPALGNPDFIRVASREMMEFTILHGRGGRQMASWLPSYSGLSRDEIDSIVLYLGQRYPLSTRFENLYRIAGQVERGGNIYRKDCQMCHGPEGTGGIGLPLNNPGFLSHASDRFLFNTVMNGRKTAGMPAWPEFSTRDMAGLIAYFRTWGKGPPEDPAIKLPEGNPEKGDLQFHYLCSRCHGDFGEGNTGPALLIPGLLDMASDSYLYRTISTGRMHTAMFGWSTNVQGEEKLDPQGISDIIAFMRIRAAEDREYIYQGSNPGSSDNGSILYHDNCAQCHGSRGEGIHAPALNNQEFLNAVSNGYLMAAMSIGRGGSRMPSWGRGTEEYSALTSVQRQDLAAFIRSWQRYPIRY